jgi:LmbE family N-acetylglucosaminyl deacetylase
MTDSDVSRRDFVKSSLATVAPAVVASALPIPSAIAEPPAAPLTILCIGAHPDDPESGCGGALARYAAAGHVVKILYLTRGERGIDGKSLDEAAHIRTLEAEAACVVLGANPLFFGQVDGAAEVTHEAVAAMTKLVAAEKPDVVFTHWPVDTHPDHRAVSLLAYDAWLRTGRTAALAYFEVLTGDQTQLFRPTDYVDISAVAARKRSACFAHASQKPEEWYPAHERMSRFRGMEHQCEQAEAFVRHDRGPALPLPA